MEQSNRWATRISIFLLAWLSTRTKGKHKISPRWWIGMERLMNVCMQIVCVCFVSKYIEILNHERDRLVKLCQAFIVRAHFLQAILPQCKIQRLKILLLWSLESKQNCKSDFLMKKFQLIKKSFPSSLPGEDFLSSSKVYLPRKKLKCLFHYPVSTVQHLGMNSKNVRSNSNLSF